MWIIMLSLFIEVLDMKKVRDLFFFMDVEIKF